MSHADERPARGASQTGRSEVRAATKPPVLVVESTGKGVARQADAADTWAISAWRTAILYLASTGRPFSADDGHELGTPAVDRPSALGGLFSGAVRAGRIRPVGYTVSRRPSRHGGAQRVYVGTSVQ